MRCSNYKYFFFMFLRMPFFGYLKAMMKEDLVSTLPNADVSQSLFLIALLGNDIEATKILTTTSDASELLKERDVFGNNHLIKHLMDKCSYEITREVIEYLRKKEKVCNELPKLDWALLKKDSIRKDEKFLRLLE